LVLVDRPSCAAPEDSSVDEKIENLRLGCDRALLADAAEQGARAAFGPYNDAITVWRV
jgi:hypothetical protein